VACDRGRARGRGAGLGPGARPGARGPPGARGRGSGTGSVHSVSTEGVTSRPGASRTRTGGLGDRRPVRWTTGRETRPGAGTGPRRRCGPPPAPASRASRRPRPDSNGRPAVPETAALSCCATGTRVPRDLRVTRPGGHRDGGRAACVPGEGLEPPMTERPTALRDAALPVARPWRGVTGADRTRSLRDHSPGALPG
jgi:hypothetical protein